MVLFHTTCSSPACPVKLLVGVNYVIPTESRIVKLFIFKDNYGKPDEIYPKEMWETRLGIWLICWHSIKQEMEGEGNDEVCLLVEAIEKILKSA
jgi:hypothetical protein